MSGPTPAVRDVVRVRAEGRCERCREPGVQIHHRKPRGMGGARDPRINQPSNLVLLCVECHGWIETNRWQAYEDGWLVRRNHDPRLTPIASRDGHDITLHNDGTKTSTPTFFCPAGQTPPY